MADNVAAAPQPRAPATAAELEAVSYGGLEQILYCVAGAAGALIGKLK